MHTSKQQPYNACPQTIFDDTTRTGMQSRILLATLTLLSTALVENFALQERECVDLGNAIGQTAL